VAKDAWEILKTTHEGTSKVKMSRLQLLTTKFENLKMKEIKNIHDFHVNILDIANSFDSLGEKMFDEKLVRKILISLPKRFDMKVTAISLSDAIVLLGRQFNKIMKRVDRKPGKMVRTSSSTSVSNKIV
jgi:hypothetical protein